MKKFKLPCLNWDDVKIGDNLNKLQYFQRNPGAKLIKGGTKYDYIDFKDIIFPNISFTSKYFSDFLSELKQIRLYTNREGYLEDYEKILLYKNLKLTFALGGLHSVDKPGIIIPNDTQILQDRDCRSMHPTLILKYGVYPKHLGSTWTECLQWAFDSRAISKPLSKDPSLSEKERKSHESLQETFKLCMNGGSFGKTGELSSWQHDFKAMLTVTINNQLFLLMLIERYLDLKEVEVKSVNTDGILLLYNKSLKSKIQEIDKQWEIDTKHFLEYTEYIKFIQTSVNDYLALCPNKDVKLKGDFVIDRELHKNPSMIIVPIALKEYFVNNIPIETSIQNHKNIYDFCLMVRMIGEFKATYQCTDNNQCLSNILLPKTIRYYASNSGGIILKHKTETLEDKFTNVNVKQNITIFNKFVNKPMSNYDIDYSFYIKECYKIINKVTKIQLSFNF